MSGLTGLTGRTCRRAALELSGSATQSVRRRAAVLGSSWVSRLVAPGPAATLPASGPLHRNSARRPETGFLRDAARRRVVARACVLFLVAGAPSGCGGGEPAASAGAEPASFEKAKIVPVADYANAPQVHLASARDFRDVWIASDRDQVLGRRDPASDEWTEFVLIWKGVFYILPAEGYASPYDRLEGERLRIPTATAYYELRRRGVPESRFRSYFVD